VSLWLDSCVSEREEVADSFVIHDKNPSGSIKSGGVLDQHAYYQIFKDTVLFLFLKVGWV
jgi:hypothetical protein